jgi:hypothetical protein
MLLTGSVMGTTTALRVGVGCAELLVERTPPLVRLALTATAGFENGKAQAEFRDELLSLTRDAAEVTWRELRRGVDDLDAYTRTGEEHALRARRRPQRVKP